jgi:hypothetical protein
MGMQPEHFDLESLLQPLSREQFFADYWEQKHYFLPRGRPDYFETLLTPCLADPSRPRR